MRDFKGIKRNRNRNRNGGGGGGGKPQNNINRAFDSNGPDGVKVRGAAQHVYEKYQQLARDAQTSGDRILAENHLQHAEHYFRVMRAMQPQRPVSDIIGRDQFVSGFDIDFEDEGGAAVEAEAEGETTEGEVGDSQGDRAWRDQRPDQRSDQRADQRGEVGYERGYDRDRGDRQFRNRDNREDRFRDGRGRDDRFRDNRGERQDRFERQDRIDRPDRGDQRPDTRSDDRSDRYERQPDRFERSEPRPRDAAEIERVAPPELEAPVLRADDGEVSHAPAFLQSRPPEAVAAPKPRRRRAPRAEAETVGEPEEN